MGAGMGTPHCPRPAGMGTAALRPAELLSHTPHSTLVPTALLLLTRGRVCAVCPGRCLPQGRGYLAVCTPGSSDALHPTSWCWQSSPPKTVPTLLLLLLQLMLMASRESPAWLQVSAVPLPQTLPSGSGKAGGRSWLCAALTPASNSSPALLPSSNSCQPGFLPCPGLEHRAYLHQAQHTLLLEWALPCLSSLSLAYLLLSLPHHSAGVHAGPSSRSYQPCGTLAD